MSLVELDPETLAQLTDRDRCSLTQGILAFLKAGAALPLDTDIWYETYRVGSAFLNT